MNIGKIITILIIAGAVAIMFLMLSDDNVDTNTTVETSNKQNTIIQKAEKIQYEDTQNDEMKKIKELKKSLDTNNDGVSKLYIVSCAPCHNKDGKGVIAPSIAQKSKEEILKSLKEYKAGIIKNTLMHGLLENISDENLTKLADEISKFK